MSIVAANMHFFHYLHLRPHLRCDVGLEEGTGLLTELYLCYSIVYYYKDHTGTSSSYRLVD